MTFATYVYRMLLRLYPLPMRESFGADMVNMFRDMMATERAKGRWHLVRFVLRTWLELPFSAWTSRRQWGNGSTQKGHGSVLFDSAADLRHAIRSLARAPTFTLTVVITLALGIGAASSTFSVLNAVLLRPLPFDSPDELVFVWHRASNHEDIRGTLAGEDLRDLQRLDQQFTAVAGTWALSTALSDGDRPQQITLSWVTPDFFSVLGVQPAIGRWFHASDVSYGDLNVLADPSSQPPLLPVVLSHALHQQRYGGDPDIVGSTLRINGQSMMVIGVTKRGFRLFVPHGADLPQTVDAWTLFPVDPTQSGRGRGNLTTIARLARNTTLADAQASVNVLANDLQNDFAAHSDLGSEYDVVQMHDAVVADTRLAILVLAGAVAFVLTIVCANVANLLVVRANSRARELAIRTAVGGGRWRLIRLVLSENVLVLAFGTGVGVLLAHFGVQLLLSIQPEALPFADQITIDRSVMVFALTVASITGIVTAVVPALRVSSTQPASALGARTELGGPSGASTRTAMVTIQVALSVVLLVGAGLMLRTLANLHRIDLGFEPNNVTTARVSLPFFSYRNPSDRLQFYNQLIDNVRQEPGVRHVGGISRIPFADADTEDWFGAFSTTTTDSSQWGSTRARYRAVVPDFFLTIGARVLAGRTLESRDNVEGAALTVVVDQTFALRAWPAQQAVGKSVLIETLNAGGTGNGLPTWAEVVGVVEPIRQTQTDTDPRGTIYVPYAVFRWFELTVVVQSSMTTADVAGIVRANVAQLDRDLPVATVYPMSAYVRDALASTRFTMTLLGTFAAIALALAAVGIYGVVAYIGRLRQTEFGIRIAFGATTTSVARSMLTYGIKPAAVGLALGIPVAVGGARFLEGLLYGIAPADPATLITIAGIMLVVSGVASIGPAWRAIHIDPVTTLRNE